MDGSTIRAFTEEVLKLAGDVDDMFETPPGALMPWIRRAHGLGKVKSSSWMDIGPQGQREGARLGFIRTPWDKTAAEKTAEPPPPKGVPIKTWDRILQHGIKRVKEKRAYKLQGHTEVQGMRIAIENRKGSVREGTDADGNEWRTKMKHPYGYIVGTKGKDGEPVDCYVGPEKEAPDAFVVHQHKDDGTGHDEDKVMLGFKSKKEAKEAYLKHYDDPKFLGPISRVSVDRLRELVRSKRRLAKITEDTRA